MQLRLLDINNFIQKHNVKEITSTRYQITAGKRIDPEGMFSEEIFGRIATKERKNTFGYINLKTTIIHPEAWNNISGIDPAISKILNGKDTFTVTNDGQLKRSDSGNTGMRFFIKIIDQLDFSLFENQKKADYFLKYKDRILIDKYLVCPAGIRDIQISRGATQTKIEASEVNKLYVRLLNNAKSLPDNIESMPDEFIETIVKNIQRTALEINAWFKSRMKGKSGIIRGGQLSKTTDYSARLVIAPDVELELGYVGLPWQIVLKLFEPFTIYYILNKNPKLQTSIQEFLNTDVGLDANTIKRFIGKLYENPKVISPALYKQLFEAAEYIVSDKMVTYKRDPVENRDSWASAYIRVEKDGYILKINPLDCARFGADFDGDTMAVYAIFSKEATQEAKEKLNPRHTKSNWNLAASADRFGYPIELDAAAAIYAMTKD